MWNVGAENDETRIPKDEGMSKCELERTARQRLGLRVSFDIHH